MNTTTQLTMFDYAALDTETRIVVKPWCSAQPLGNGGCAPANTTIK